LTFLLTHWTLTFGDAETPIVTLKYRCFRKSQKHRSIDGFIGRLPPLSSFTLTSKTIGFFICGVRRKRETEKQPIYCCDPILFLQAPLIFIASPTFLFSASSATTNGAADQSGHAKHIKRKTKYAKRRKEKQKHLQLQQNKVITHISYVVLVDTVFFFAKSKNTFFFPYMYEN